MFHSFLLLQWLMYFLQWNFVNYCSMGFWLLWWANPHLLFKFLAWEFAPLNQFFSPVVSVLAHPVFHISPYPGYLMRYYLKHKTYLFGTFIHFLVADILARSVANISLFPGYLLQWITKKLITPVIVLRLTFPMCLDYIPKSHNSFENIPASKNRYTNHVWESRSRNRYIIDWNFYMHGVI